MWAEFGGHVNLCPSVKGEGVELVFATFGTAPLPIIAGDDPLFICQKRSFVSANASIRNKYIYTVPMERFFKEIQHRTKIIQIWTVP